MGAIAGTTSRASVPLLAAEGLSYRYPARHDGSPALQAVSFTLAAGEILAVVGESGSGKSTLARILSGLLAADQGLLAFKGGDIGGLARTRQRAVLKQIQIVFQNPDGSLNPRHRVGTILARPLRHFLGLDGEQLTQRVARLLVDVRLPAHYAARYPAELSGGERQRVAIARALAAEPELIVCDEVTSALDMSVKAALLDLLKDVQRRTGVAMLFITHDLPVVRWFADRALVLHRGRVCEDTPVPAVFLEPRHAYTAELIEAAWHEAWPGGSEPARRAPPA
jgi:ABC-type glutathione transport system ATPase component